MRIIFDMDTIENIEESKSSNGSCSEESSSSEESEKIKDQN